MPWFLIHILDQWFSCNQQLLLNTHVKPENSASIAFVSIKVSQHLLSDLTVVLFNSTTTIFGSGDQEYTLHAGLSLTLKSSRYSWKVVCFTLCFWATEHVYPALDFWEKLKFSSLRLQKRLFCFAERRNRHIETFSHDFSILYWINCRYCWTGWAI